MRFFCLNLKDSTLRRASAEAEFEREGVPIEFVIAYPAAQSGIVAPTKMFTSGMIGCAISHERLLEEAVRNKYGPFIIFEDDIQLQSNFMNRLKSAMDSLPEQWDMAFLGWYCSDSREWKEDRGWYVSPTTGFSAGFLCYAVNGAESAARVHSLMHPLRTQIDLQIMEAGRAGKLNIHYAVDKLAFTNLACFPTTVQPTGTITSPFRMRKNI